MKPLLTTLFLLAVSLLIPTAAWEASTSANLAINVTAGQAITAVGLSNSTFTVGAASGTVVGGIGVTMSPSSPAFSGSLSLSGTNASSFQIIGSNLETNGAVAAGTYNINIAATEAGATGSPFTAAETITGTSGTSDPTTGLLPPANDAYVNWTMAGMQAAGGIPLSRSTVCATINPIGGGSDDTNNIQNAISSCPAGEVVSLAAGTFTVKDGNFILLNKGITLRGAGPGSTIIQRTNGCPPLSPSSNGSCGSNPSPFIIVGPEQYNNWVTSTNLTADVAQGAYSAQVTSASGFSVGQAVLLDEMSGASYQPDVGLGGSSQIWAAPDYRVVWQKHNPSWSNDDFSSSQYPYQNNTAGCWFATAETSNGTNQRCDRTTSEIKKIAAIGGNTITFDSPVTISYRVANMAQLSYYTMPFTSGAGVEQLTMKGADNQSLQFLNAINSWAYRVECTQWLGHGCIAVDGSLRVQIEQFYVHDGAWPEPGGGGYALEMCCGSTEILFENGISVRADKNIVSLQAGAGSVIAYNYADQAFICCNNSNPSNGSDGWIENGLNNSHYPGGHHALFEGNLTHQMGEDETHGNSTHNSYFRNWSQGYRIPSWTNAFDGATINDLSGSPEGTPGPLKGAETQLFTYWESFIGNVLGYPGYSTATNGWTYVNDTGNPGIFVLGWISDEPNPDPKAGLDTNGQGGMTEVHGNYDYLQNTVTWDSNYSNHNLPSSFYLTSASSFFGPGAHCTYTWPWVTPTGSPVIQSNSCGGSGLPAKARFDAGTPFTQP